MSVIEVQHVTHRYGRLKALDDVSFSVPGGSIYALLGPNGSGKTTLLRILTGILRATAGSATVLGKGAASLDARDRDNIGYVAEGQSLPEWMTLMQLEDYLAPLYGRWDRKLSANLRTRFNLPRDRKIRTLSRGEQMKAAMLSVLAARPQLLIMDEPFAGMDALVRDDLVRGLLDSVTSEGVSVLIASHELDELETMIDGVAFLNHGRLLFANTADVMRSRFQRVEIQLDNAADAGSVVLNSDCLDAERSQSRISFIHARGDDEVSSAFVPKLPPSAVIETRPATLREVFLALARTAENKISDAREVA